MSATAAFGLILAMLAVGKLLAWRRVVPDGSANTLNLVVLYVCLPAAVLLYAPRLTFDRELAGLIAVPYLILIAASVLTLLLARWLRFSRALTAVLLLQIPLGNTSFLGFALMPALAGEDALRYAVVYDQFGSFIILSTFGLITIGFYGGQRTSLRAILVRIFTFVPFIALVLALTLMPREYPPVIAGPLKLLADSLLPLVALASGMQLQLRLPHHHRLPLAYGLTAKLLLMPLLALGLAALLGLQGQMRDAAVYETAMPPMITAGALLSLAGLEPELAAAMVGFGLILSMASLPLWHVLLGS
ncbi:MAG: AEC family transporter [Dokdonella sp.]|uniref:AEC family transporter n=1 Tax=Dokdonella sp. TaxID=2291710 RepID=UPI0025BF2503|nr:AEC family transporter [Dokdonella sp.]MBZ0224195.1 AEC family transporter [Dokdonella sp.]